MEENKEETTWQKSHINKIVENEDYYTDSIGDFVFTEEYHLKRGFCCENGCWHCPYGFKQEIIL